MSRTRPALIHGPTASEPSEVDVFVIDAANTQFLNEQRLIARSRLFGHRFARAYKEIKLFLGNCDHPNRDHRLVEYSKLLHTEMVLYEGSSPKEPVHTQRKYARFRQGLLSALSSTEDVAFALRDHFGSSPGIVSTSEDPFMAEVPLGKVRWWHIVHFNLKLTVSNIQSVVDQRRYIAEWLKGDDDGGHSVVPIVTLLTLPGSRTGTRTAASALTPRVERCKRASTPPGVTSSLSCETNSSDEESDVDVTEGPVGSVLASSDADWRVFYEEETAHIERTFSSLKVNPIAVFRGNRRRAHSILQFIDGLVKNTHLEETPALAQDAAVGFAGEGMNVDEPIASGAMSSDLDSRIEMVENATSVSRSPSPERAISTDALCAIVQTTPSDAAPMQRMVALPNSLTDAQIPAVSLANPLPVPTRSPDSTRVASSTAGEHPTCTTAAVRSAPLSNPCTGTVSSSGESAIVLEPVLQPTLPTVPSSSQPITRTVPKMSKSPNDEVSRTTDVNTAFEGDASSPPTVSDLTRAVPVQPASPPPSIAVGPYPDSHAPGLRAPHSPLHSAGIDDLAVDWFAASTEAPLAAEPTRSLQDIEDDAIYGVYAMGHPSAMLPFSFAEPVQSLLPDGGPMTVPFPSIGTPSTSHTVATQRTDESNLSHSGDKSAWNHFEFIGHDISRHAPWWQPPGTRPSHLYSETASTLQASPFRDDRFTSDVAAHPALIHHFPAAPPPWAFAGTSSSLSLPRLFSSTGDTARIEEVWEGGDKLDSPTGDFQHNSEDNASEHVALLSADITPALAGPCGTSSTSAIQNDPVLFQSLLSPPILPVTGVSDPPPTVDGRCAAADAERNPLEAPLPPLPVQDCSPTGLDTAIMLNS
ncbi:unnamed protein product [Peniophora sp. CBMAI 1063]|nr:unnamed protein product [Peniophora sp. CBMAI 1063]